MAKILDNKSIGVSQQLVNTYSTTIQHPDPVESSQNGHKFCQTSNTASNKISQQVTKPKGEREAVKPPTPNGVLQTPVQGGGGKGKGEIIYTIFYSSFPNPLFRCEEEVVHIGDRL